MAAITTINLLLGGLLNQTQRPFTLSVWKIYFRWVAGLPLYLRILLANVDWSY